MMVVKEFECSLSIIFGNNGCALLIKMFLRAFDTGLFHDLRELLPLYAVIRSDGSINKRLKIPPSNHAIE